MSEYLMVEACGATTGAPSELVAHDWLVWDLKSGELLNQGAIYLTRRGGYLLNARPGVLWEREAARWAVVHVLGLKKTHGAREDRS